MRSSVDVVIARKTPGVPEREEVVELLELLTY